MKVGRLIIQGAPGAPQLEIGVDSFSHDLGGSENRGGGWAAREGLEEPLKAHLQFSSNLAYQRTRLPVSHVHLCAGDNPLF